MCLKDKTRFRNDMKMKMKFAPAPVEFKTQRQKRDNAPCIPPGMKEGNMKYGS